jgi:hypothetical protein
VRHCAPLEIKVVVVPEVGAYVTGVAVDVPVFVEVELAGCAAVEFKV